MKHFFFLAICALLIVSSCKKNDSQPSTYPVTIQLTNDNGNNFTETTGVVVKLTSQNNVVFEGKSDAAGKATIQVPAGVYQASASYTQIEGLQNTVYNGNGESNITVGADWTGTEIAKIKMIKARLSQLVIKEIFVGGTPKDDGSGVTSTDGYIVLYNNSDASVSLSNLCIGTISPANAQAQNNYYDADEKTLLYAAEKWMPALSGFWYFQQNISLQSGKQIVVALHNAVNNTITYNKSINFDNSEYYAMYDLASGYNNSNYYVAPAASIPSSHYLKAEKYGTGNAWIASFTSPGIFIFQTKNTTPSAFGNDASTTHILNGATSTTSKKVPTDWIIDGVEGYLLANTNNKKRFLPDVDAGYVYHTNRLGYSIYRNVDKKATEAITSNNGKLVYNYSLGTKSIGGTTDPSNIDAEASIKNGARIIYMDTNNSTNDFHLRSKASLSNN